MRVGWIGLGEMGAPMASRALAGGHRLTAYDRGSGRQALRERGGVMAASYDDVAAASELLCVCLYDDRQVSEVLLNEGLLARMRSGSIVAVHTTGSPSLARRLHAQAPAGVAVLDAAFSGSPAKARAGELTVMVGGAAAALERARPVFETYAGIVHHVGGPGAGQSMKLLNNLLFAAHLALASEALELAPALGLDPGRVASALRDASGASAALALFASMASPLEVRAGAAPYLRKDIASIVAAASEADLDLGRLLEVAGQGWDTAA